MKWLHEGLFGAGLVAIGEWCRFSSFSMSANSLVNAIVAVPEIPFKADEGTFVLGDLKSIILDPRHANATDNKGQTLIPPTLAEFTRHFQEDLESIFGLQVPVLSGEKAAKGSIFITLSDDNSKFVDVAGRHTSEGYSLEIGESVIVSGASPLGSWWATRSILQLAILNSQNLQYGIATDAPGWANRGLMVSFMKSWDETDIADSR